MSELTLTLGQQIAPHVAIATQFLQRARNEALYKTVETAVEAFEDAVKENCFDTSGNDRHKHCGGEISPLSTAIGNTHGFLLNPLFKERNPNSFLAFQKLREAATIIHLANC